MIFVRNIYLFIYFTSVSFDFEERANACVLLLIYFFKLRPSTLDESRLGAFAVKL